MSALTKIYIKLKGIPTIILVLSLVFWATFTIGEPIQKALQSLIDTLASYLSATLPVSWWQSLLVDGILQGVGALLTALPNILLLFFFLGLMEETNYLAQVSYYTDGFMHKIGLHGHSFIPLLMGFGCNVPAILAARDVEDKRERTLTMLMVPFISCSGRLPIYLLLISSVFPTHKALVLGSLYLFSLLFSLGFAVVMTRTPWFKPSTQCMIHTKPQLHTPNWRNIGRLVGNRTLDFLGSVCTVVVIASVVIWVLEYFPAGDLQHLDSSWLAAIGKVLEPIMRPLGFEWKMSMCLLAGLPAKEAIASTFAILSSAGSPMSAMSPSVAYAFLIFTLLYFPCLATIATIRRQLNAKWAVAMIIYSLILAWGMAFIIRQVGCWVGL